MRHVIFVLAIAVSFLAGTFSVFLSSSFTFAQGRKAYPDPEKVVVRLHGFARGGETPEEAKPFNLIAENNAYNSLPVVAKGKKLVITDMMFESRHAQKEIIVNLNQRIEDKSSPNFGKSHYLQQITIKPGESKEINLCTGYVIHEGNSVVAWTQYGLQPGQWVQMSLTGYIVDETVPIL